MLLADRGGPAVHISRVDRVREGEELAQEFICVICLDLVLEPMECDQCHNIQCRECLVGVG